MQNLNYCPKCKSTNIHRGKVYYTPVGVDPKLFHIFKEENRDRCLDCKYQDTEGQFEVDNRIEIRNKKLKNY